MILRATAAAAVIAGLISVGGGTARTPTRPGAHPATGAAVILPAGQTGPRSAVPWRLVGTGWVLAQYSASDQSTAGRTTLYLIDPRGGRYTLFSWPATASAPTLEAWSGDKARALLVAGGGVRTWQMVLATGRQARVALPRGTDPLGYTRPDGLNLLAASSVSGRFEISRYSLAGRLQQKLASGPGYLVAVDNPDGATLAVSGAHGLELVSNLGGVVRSLPVRGAGCSPIRWWTARTVLADCATSKLGLLSRLWLVPASAAAPTALTPPRGRTGIDLGDYGAWRLRSGLYLQARGACGSTFIARQAPSGSVTEINIAGTLNADNNALAADGQRLLVHARTWLLHAPCGAEQSLLWYNPATRAEQWLFKAPKGVDGVLAAIAYGRPNG